ncbi:MAG: hypothetical protein IJV65_07625 [Kiritimatiellae bacterium]|nr:hypothetical protein [Kiritimatiellia bacterium]
MEGNRNPAAALDALTHPATTKVGRFEVRELYLGTLAVLERIGSPLVDPDAPRTLLAWAETLYALTRPAPDCLRALAGGRDAYRNEAAAWADTVTNAEATALMAAAGAAMRRLKGANPAEDGPEEGVVDCPDPTAAGPTAGSPGV